MEYRTLCLPGIRTLDRRSLLEEPIESMTGPSHPAQVRT